MDNGTVKGNIEKLRKSRNLSQQEMAERLGMSRNAYRSIEKGRTRLVSENLDRIAEVLGTEIHEILGYGTTHGTDGTLEDIRQDYIRKTSELSSRYREEEDRLTDEIRRLNETVATLNEYITALKETVKTKDDIINMLKRTKGE